MMKVVHVKSAGTVSIGGVKMEIQYKTRDGKGKDFIKIVKIKEFPTVKAEPPGSSCIAKE